jgi:hypothetical protein
MAINNANSARNRAQAEEYKREQLEKMNKKIDEARAGLRKKKKDKPASKAPAAKTEDKMSKGEFMKQLAVNAVKKTRDSIGQNNQKLRAVMDKSKKNLKEIQK